MNRFSQGEESPTPRNPSAECSALADCGGTDLSFVLHCAVCHPQNKLTKYINYPSKSAVLLEIQCKCRISLPRLCWLDLGSGCSWIASRSSSSYTEDERPRSTGRWSRPDRCGQ